jgi:DNA-directed RNA polymerase
VHVDGSFNGMQHYSALGRDQRGGTQVNLVNSEKPGDVYTTILKLVNNEIDNEKEE